MGHEQQRQGDHRGRDSPRFRSRARQANAHHERDHHRHPDGHGDGQRRVQQHVVQAERGVGDALELLFGADGEDREGVARDGAEADVAERQHAGAADVDLDAEHDDGVDQHHRHEALGRSALEALVDEAAGQEHGEEQGASGDGEADVTSEAREHQACPVTPARRA